MKINYYAHTWNGTRKRSSVMLSDDLVGLYVMILEHEGEEGTPVELVQDLVNLMLYSYKPEYGTFTRWVERAMIEHVKGAYLALWDHLSEGDAHKQTPLPLSDK